MAILTQRSQQRTASSRFEQRGESPVARRLLARLLHAGSFGREFVLMLCAYFAYFAVRGLTEGSDEKAVDHAQKILSLEKAATRAGAHAGSQGQ